MITVLVAIPSRLKMAVVAQRTRMGLEEIGSTTSVPDNNIAKLMYYLSCMCSLLGLDDDADLRRSTDYKNYYRLDDDDIDKLLVFCILLSPDELEGKCIFQDDDMCGDSNNNFFEISEVKSTLLVSQSILVGGESKEVQKIMTYKAKWMIDYYIDPIASFHRRLLRISKSIQSGGNSRSSNCCCIIL